MLIASSLPDTLNSAETAKQNLIHEWHWTWALTAVIDCVLFNRITHLFSFFLLLVSIYPFFSKKNSLRIIIFKKKLVDRWTKKKHRNKRIKSMKCVCFFDFSPSRFLCLIEQTKFRANENGKKQLCDATKYSTASSV